MVTSYIFNLILRRNRFLISFKERLEYNIFSCDLKLIVIISSHSSCIVCIENWISLIIRRSKLRVWDSLIILSFFCFQMRTICCKATIYGLGLIDSKDGHLIVVSVVIYLLPNFLLSLLFFIRNKFFGASITEGRLANSPTLNHLHKPGVIFGFSKLLNQLYQILRVSEVEALLRLDAALFKGAEHDSRFCVLLLRRWIVLREKHGLEEEPYSVRIEKATCWGQGDQVYDVLFSLWITFEIETAKLGHKEFEISTESWSKVGVYSYFFKVLNCLLIVCVKPNQNRHRIFLSHMRMSMSLKIKSNHI